MRFIRISVPNLFLAEMGSISAFGSSLCHVSTRSPSWFCSLSSILLIRRMTGISIFETFSRKSMFLVGVSRTSVT